MRLLNCTIMRPYQRMYKEILDTLGREDKLTYRQNDMFSLVLPHVTKVESFTQPLVKENHVYIDGRHFYKTDGTLRGMRQNFDHMIYFGMFDHAYQYRREELEGSANVLSSVFAMWAAQTINRRLNLNAADLEVAKMFLFGYYWTLCQREEIFSRYRDGELIETLMRSIQTSLRVSRAMVEAYANALQNIFSGPANLNETVAKIIELFEKPNVKLTGDGLIVAMSERAWFGLAAVQTAGIACEHPGYLCYMVSLVERFGAYRNTGIGNAAEAAKRLGNDISQGTRRFNELDKLYSPMVGFNPQIDIAW